MILAGAAAASAEPLRTVGLGTFAVKWDGRTPPAALVRFARQSLDDKAYVLGCGHCNGMPVGGYVADAPLAKKVYLNGSSGRPVGLDTVRIVYGTQTSVDLVLLELALTYREIEARYGMSAREIAAAPAPIGSPIWFYNLEEVQSCRIDEWRARYEFNEDGTDFLADAYIYYGCISLGGHSGSILISQETDQVVGLNVGGIYPEIRDGHVINYGSTVAPLSRCLDQNSRFDLRAPGCALRIGE